MDRQYNSKLVKCFIYEHEEKDGNAFRYVLGYQDNTVLMNQKYFVCIGGNPSVADDQKLDQTVYRVEETALKCNCSGWIMFNLFPQRATNPKDLVKARDFKNNNDMKSACKHNIDYIESVLSEYRKQVLYIWCAWGWLIKKRTYCRESFHKIYQVINKLSLKNKCLYYRDKESDSKHPRHPSRLPRNFVKCTFPIEEYHEKLKDKY